MSGIFGWNFVLWQTKTKSIKKSEKREKESQRENERTTSKHKKKLTVAFAYVKAVSGSSDTFEPEAGNRRWANARPTVPNTSVTRAPDLNHIHVILLSCRSHLSRGHRDLGRHFCSLLNSYSSIQHRLPDLVLSFCKLSGSHFFFFTEAEPFFVRAIFHPIF